MSLPGNTSSGGKSSKIRYIWIAAALAALAIILSPVSPLSVFQHQSSQPQSQVGSSNNTAGALSNPTAAVDTTQPPQPTDLSNQDLAYCNSLSSSVDYVISGGNAGTGQPLQATNNTNTSSNSTMTHEQRVASGLVVGEACNRPQLLHELNASSFDVGTSLVAYGCDAAAGKIGDIDLQNSLNSYQAVYCNAAVTSITNGAASLLSNVQSFRTALTQQSQGNATSTNSTATNSAASTSATLDKIVATANKSTLNLSPGSMYSDAQLLGQASSMFTNVIRTATTTR